MSPSVAFLAGWVAACLTVAASVLWLTNAGAGRRLHQPLGADLLTAVEQAQNPSIHSPGEEDAS